MYFVSYLIGTMLGGALFGLIPFFIGRKSNPKLAKIALLASALTALIHAWVTLITVIVFSIILVTKSGNTPKSDNTDSTN